MATDEEGETCLHLAFARHTANINLDQADAVQQVFYRLLVYVAQQSAGGATS